MRRIAAAALGARAVLTSATEAFAQLSPAAAWAAHAANEYQVIPTVTYQLLTIPGGCHGNFTPDERTRIFAT